MAAVVSALADINTQPSKKHDEAPQKTPIIQRIINSDLETPSASPTLRAGFNFVSPSVPPAHASIPLNDDEAERRQRRLESRRKDFMSPGGHTPKNITSTADRRKQCSAGSQYSNAQIADHYKQCVKLSSENKINSKNAFGLHLIDYMADMLHRGGDMTNFQVAGCTIDASAKIYAGRVDSIYNDAYKMLGGLGRGSKGNEGENDQENVDTDATSTQKKQRKNPNRAATVQTVERNWKSLDVATFDLEFEVDPLYKKTSAAFDEGGIEGLLLNQLHIEDDYLSLKLDPTGGLSVSDTVPSGSAIMLTSLAECMNVVDLARRDICPTFRNFEFQGAQGDEELWHLSSAQEKVSPTGKSSPTELQGSDDDDEPAAYHRECSFAELHDNLSMEPNGVDIHEEQVDVDNQYPPPATCHVPNFEVRPQADSTEGSRSVYCLSDVLQESEYSYFKSDVLSAWAGPQFWKRRLANKMTRQLTKSKKKEPKKAFRIDFTAEISENEFLPGKGSTVLSRTAISKMEREPTTLPHDDNTEALSLFRLFHNPDWTVKQVNVDKEQLDTGDDATDCYNYSNENDVNNFCPAFEYGGGDDDDDPSQGSSSLHETFVPFGNDTHVPGYDQSLSQPLSTALVGDNLIAQPKKVQPLAIEYSRIAKKIDVKKVKSKIWSIITKSQENDQTEGHPLTFTEMYEDVPRGLGESTKRNLSVPICFVCLLHLANEKNLVITGSEDMSDLYVGCEQ